MEKRMQELFDPLEPAFLQWISDHWRIDIHCVRHDMDIPGSPERTLSRGVLQDTQGRVFLVEKFGAEKFGHRDRVARAVAYLSVHGLTQALAYNRSVNGEFLPFFRGACFQLSRFVEGTPLKRPMITCL